MTAEDRPSTLYVRNFKLGETIAAHFGPYGVTTIRKLAEVLREGDQRDGLQDGYVSEMSGRLRQAIDPSSALDQVAYKHALKQLRTGLVRN